MDPLYIKFDQSPPIMCFDKIEQFFSEKKCDTIFYMVTFLAFIFYCMGVGVAVGFSVATHPGYNFTTGCPIDLPDCPVECSNNACDQIVKMKCYSGNIGDCYYWGLLGMIVIPVVFLCIATLIYQIYIISTNAYNYCTGYKITNDIDVNIDNV